MKSIITLLFVFLSFASFGQIAVITGSVTACVGVSTTLYDATPGGTWSSSTPVVATIGPSTGTVTAISAGITTITYTVGSSFVTTGFTVDPLPAAITGTPSLCPGTTTTLSSATSGGTWVSGMPAIAVVGSATGIVTGIAPGVANIYYSTTRCSVIMPVTVNPGPGAITGPSTVCVGSSVTLSSSTSGGVWTSSSVVATVGSGSGVVTGVVAGTSVITYTLGTGCSRVAMISVNPLPTITTSATPACGGSYTLTAGGAVSYVWSPSTGLSCTACSTTTTGSSTTGAYTVTGTDAFGCVGWASVTVSGNRISGHISPAGLAAVKVWLVQFNWSDSSIIATDSMMTCTDGGMEYYEFASPASGHYRVKANLPGGTPGSSGYIPTYGTSTPNWYSADTLIHTTGTDTMHIGLIYGTVPSGPGFISGYVISGAGKGTADVPAVGMLVYLKDAMGNVLTYTHTDAAGLYSFSALGLGTYYIYPEDYKYYTTPSAAVTLGSSSTAATHISFRQSTSYGTIVPFVTTISQTQPVANGITVYPNPAQNELFVNGLAGSMQYQLLSITGAVIMQGVLQPGNNALSTTDVAAGVYILELTNERAEKSRIKVVKE